MITLRVEAPYGSFRKSYARSYAETYPFPPPATIYGMLLSLVGEELRSRHAGVRLAFAYRARPKVATTLRKLSRYKYGMASKQAKLGNAPDYVETLCGIDFLCWVDSSKEAAEGVPLEARLRQALERPDSITRTGVVYLGLSDDAVNEVSLWRGGGGPYFWLSPSPEGPIELPVWVDHVAAQHTRWRRYIFDEQPMRGHESPEERRYTELIDPRSSPDLAPPHRL